MGSSTDNGENVLFKNLAAVTPGNGHGSPSAARLSRGACHAANPEGSAKKTVTALD